MIRPSESQNCPWSYPGGDETDSAEWLVKKFGDVNLHETVIPHIGRLLDGEFARNKLHETPKHFARRMKQVADHMNPPASSACGGTGLLGLSKELRRRCEEVKRCGGERIPK